MTLRMLHIADLHIGQVLRYQSRSAEHQFMLNWVVEQIEQHKIDVLLIAGDIFDAPNPKPEAQALFYQFLARASQCESIRSIVIIAGNHDSAKRMCAIYAPLNLLNVHILGAVQNHSDAWDQWLIPIHDSEGEVVATVAGVPFIHEFMLNFPRNLTRTQRSKRLKSALKDLYSHFVELSEQRYGTVPVVGMGHLSAMSDDATMGYMPKEVHTVLENALDGEVFDERYRYVALGHIHKSYRVRGNSNVWYSGSPLACSIDEAEDGTERGAFLIELDPAIPHPQPQKLVMPMQRRLLRYRGTKEELISALMALPETLEHPHFLWLELTENHQYIDLYKELKQLLDGHYPQKTPVIIHLNELGVSDDEEMTVDLEFVARYTQGGNPSLAKLFRSYIQICGVDDSEGELLSRLEYAARETEGVLQHEESEIDSIEQTLSASEGVSS